MVSFAQRVWGSLKLLRADRSGHAMLEYALIGTIIAIALIGTIVVVRNGVETLFTSVLPALS